MRGKKRLGSGNNLHTTFKQRVVYMIYYIIMHVNYVVLVSFWAAGDILSGPRRKCILCTYTAASLNDNMYILLLSLQQYNSNIL